MMCGCGVDWLAASSGVDRLRGSGANSRLGAGGCDNGSPILPMRSRSWLRRNSNGHNVAPDISVGDGLAMVTLAGGIPRWSLSNCDSNRSRADCWVGRSRRRSNWSRSGIWVDRSDDWIAAGRRPHARGQVCGVVGRSSVGSDWSRAGDEGSLRDVVSRSVRSVVSLRHCRRCNALSRFRCG